MVKIDIISGFLGAGKTTLIKKLIKEALNGEKVVLLENEFGDVGIDGTFMKNAGIEITEMNSGCICCSLVGDFSKSLQKIIEDFNPERIIIEPSGVGKLSDVVRAVEDIDGLKVNSSTVVADALKCKMYSKNFGEFYNNQIEHATSVILSRTADISEEKLQKAMEVIRSLNKEVPVITTDWDALDGRQILSVMEGAVKDLVEEEFCHECGHVHHHDEHCHHDHHEHHEHCHHDEHHHEPSHEPCHDHHHDHDDHCDCQEHEHHHEHDHCCCHDHHEHHHHADDVFTSLGIETAKKFDVEEIKEKLQSFENGGHGVILRSKGILQDKNGEWFEFDYVPEEFASRKGTADYTGRIVFIGTKLDEEKIKSVFSL